VIPEVKSVLKSIYLSFRKHVLKILSIIVGSEQSFHDISEQYIKNILFIRIDRIGDLVLSTPALKAIKKAYQHAKLVVLSSPSNCSLLFNNPYIDQIIVYDRRNKLKDRIKIVRQLREYNFDLAIDPYADYELETALIALLSGAKKRVGYASYGREVFFNIQAPKIKDNQYLVDLTLDILKPLGIMSANKSPELFLSENEKKWARNWLTKRGIGGKTLVGIHPGGNYETQRWLPERFAEVAKHLIRNGYSDVLIFGAPGDKGLVNQICSIVEAEVPTYIGSDIRQFASLVCSCKILICNNSGPLHIAVALNIPTISMMGPTNKDRWMPIGDIHKVLRIDNLPCIGCNLGHCKIKTHDCMRLITSSMVIEAVKNILDKE
jgi:heptosyltransferase-2